MDYKWHHDLLVDRARRRVITGYSERHHIIPRCLGGSNAAENIVRLLPEEHYLVHQLLVKMHPHHAGLVSAALMMSGESSPFCHRNNKAYGWLRRRYSVMVTGRVKSPEHIAKLAAANKGKKRSAVFKAAVGAFHTGRKRPAETGQKISASHKKRCRTPEFRERMRLQNLGKKRSAEFADACKHRRLGTQHSAETKAKMRAAKIGKTKSAETRQRMSDAQRKRYAASRAAL